MEETGAHPHRSVAIRVGEEVDASDPTVSKQPEKAVAFSKELRVESEDAPSAKRAKGTAPKQTHPQRIASASDSNVASILGKFLEKDHVVHHACLSWQMRNAKAGGPNVHQIQAKEVSAVEADMDLYPPWEATEHFGAGLASYFGMVKLAEELAVILYKDPRAAVVVSDRLGKDYAPLVCRFVCILAKGMSHSLFDELRDKAPLPKNKLLRSWVSGPGTLTNLNSVESLSRGVQEKYYAPIEQGVCIRFSCL